MPNAIEKTARFVDKPAHLGTGVHLPLTPIMGGHGNPGQRSNNGVRSGDLDNSGAMNGESGDRAGKDMMHDGSASAGLDRWEGEAECLRGVQASSASDLTRCSRSHTPTRETG